MQRLKWKKRDYHTIRIVLKPNSKIIEAKGNIDSA